MYFICYRLKANFVFYLCIPLKRGLFLFTLHTIFYIFILHHPFSLYKLHSSRSLTKMATLLDIVASTFISILAAFSCLHLHFSEFNPLMTEFTSLNDTSKAKNPASTNFASTNFAGKLVNLDFKTYFTFLNGMPQRLKLFKCLKINSFNLLVLILLLFYAFTSLAWVLLFFTYYYDLKFYIFCFVFGVL